MSLLDDARKRINAIDADMARLFEERMQAVEDVIRYKQEHQMQVLDTSREQYVIEHNTSYIQQEAYRDSYIEFITDMLAISRKYQRSIINRDLVGYSGTEGAFSHIAAEKVFPDHRKKAMQHLKMCFRQ
ncbi:putative chorismate mutase [Erysipelotrichaceae bacterium 3_1_53]|nr:putative chorismate mutase [Erysipelotrichaceae bacterium 3_1_53]